MVRILQLILSASIIFSFSHRIVAQLATKEHSTINQQQIISSITASPKIKSLSVGDKVPEIEFQMLNYSSPVAKLSDFKGKLLLLDFWATWCGPCIGSFPKLD